MRKGSRESVAAIKRAENARRTLAEANGHTANGKNPKASRPAAGMTPAERRLLEDERAAKTQENAARDSLEAETGVSLPTGAELAGRLQDGPTATEAAPKKIRARSLKKQDEAAPGASQEPNEAPVAGLPAVIAPPASEVVVEAPLTEEEERELEEDIAAIRADEDRAQEIGVSIGARLKNIVDKRLYRRSHGDFAAFVEANFSFSVMTAYRLIKAQEAIANLEAAGVERLPSPGRVARALADHVPEDKQAEVWRAAEAIATGEGEDIPLHRHVMQAAEAAGAIAAPAPTGRRGRPKGSKNKPKGGGTTPKAGRGKGGSRETGAAVEQGREDGVIPAGAEVRIESQEGETDEERSARVRRDDGPDSDDDWLELFPIRDSLTVNTRRVFDASALGYRRIEKGLEEFRIKWLRPACEKAEAVLHGDVGPYLVRFQWAARTRHPSQWKACVGCKGTGQLAKNKGPCNDCKGNGFLL